ncbi:MAG: cyclic nucleotide-binding domain-containing protein, partial [Candidatus Acidiferrales bacterium]
MEYANSQKIYSQGDSAKNVYYIQNGEIKLSVINEAGKEAVVAILSSGDFFGETCLAGQNLRMGTATAITPATLLVIEKPEMISV